MKKLIKLAAFVMVLTLIVTVFAGCHKKNEVAYTVGDTEFTSAFYSCVLYNIAKSTRSAIDAYVSSIATDSEETPKIVYSDYKFDDDGNVDPNGSRKYNDFVKEETVKLLKQYAVVYAKLKEADKLLTEDEQYSADLNAQSYWYIGCDYSTYYYYNQYGYDVTSYYTPLETDLTANGVAMETYISYFEYETLLEKYFDLLYSEGGEKEVSVDELNAYLTEHYALGAVLSLSMTGSDGSELTEEELAAVEDKANAYAARINAGESFDTIYKEYEAENTTDADEEEETTETADTEESEEYEPASYLTLFGDSDTSYSSDLYETVKALENGKATVTSDSTNGYYIVSCKQDILAESYWLEQVRDSILVALKQDEYLDYIEEISASAEVKENKYATGAFKVKNIEFTSSAS